MVGTITHRRADFFPNRINQFVNGMLYAADVHDDGMYKLSFGAPAVSDPNGIVAAFTITGGVTIEVADMVGAVEGLSDAPWGRTVVVDASAAGTPLCTVHGFDYLGQAMSENITMAGTTAVEGNKAFMRVTQFVVASGITGTFDAGFLDELGLPYKTIAILEEIEDGAPNGTIGAVVVGVLTDPQVATTGDPRGTYNPTGTLDATADITIVARADNWINAAGNGGYYGIKHVSTL